MIIDYDKGAFAVILKCDEIETTRYEPIFVNNYPAHIYTNGSIIEGDILISIVPHGEKWTLDRELLARAFEGVAATDEEAFTACAINFFKSIQNSYRASIAISRFWQYAPQMKFRKASFYISSQDGKFHGPFGKESDYLDIL